MALDFPDLEQLPGLLRGLIDGDDGRSRQARITMGASPARIARFDDGIVVFDPVTGQLVTIAPMAAGILELLEERIGDGMADREILLAELLDELKPIEVATVETKKLMEWIELARHLYA